MKKSWAVLISGGLALLVGIFGVGKLLHAQAQADSSLQIESVSAEDLPRVGTFYLLSDCQRAHTFAPPYPAYIWPERHPIFSLNGIVYLVDDLVGAAGHDAALAGALEELETRVEQQLWSQAMMLAGMGAEMELDEEGSGFGPLADLYSSSDLWLEMVSVTNAASGQTALLVIHPPDAESESRFDLYFTTNLDNLAAPELCLTNWTWLLRSESGVTNLVVTNLTGEQGYFMLGRTNDDDSDDLTTAFELLVSHSDPTNWDTDGDGLPDGWEWNNFGNFDQTPAGDFDGDGVSNGDEYTNHTDPNSISFSLIVTNQYVSTDSAWVQLNVTGGVPSGLALMPSSTNLESAVWQQYSTSNLLVSTGSMDGEYEVWVGLRGRMETSDQTWHGVTITRDTVPPVIVITNPAVTTVSQPVIQLQGYANEPLASLFYDVTNASGSFSNLEGSVVGQWLDTNTLRLTTNWFQCYDIALTNGANLITLHATDLAGNVTTTNLTLTLDYSGDTNAPQITVDWPLDNAQVAGTNFTLSGTVDDPTAHVSVSIGSDTFVAAVERDGRFSVSGLPLAADTNSLTVTATDAAGNSGTRSWTVRKGALVATVTVDPITADQLTGTTVTLTGTINTNGLKIWGNSVQATISNGLWTATLPTPDGGIANFDIQVGDDLSTAIPLPRIQVESPPRVRAVSFSEELRVNANTIYFAAPPFCGASTDPIFRTRTRAWQEGRGDNTSSQHYDCHGCGGPTPCDFLVAWPTNWPGGATLEGANSCSTNGYSEESISAWQYSDWNDGVTYSAVNDLGCLHLITRAVHREARTGLVLTAGGSAGKGQRLIRLTAHADACPCLDFVDCRGAHETWF